MNVTKIIQEWLINNGYHGLYSPGECSCDADDLFPCGYFSTDCEPGHKMPCDCEMGCEYHIGITSSVSSDTDEKSQQNKSQ